MIIPSCKHGVLSYAWLYFYRKKVPLLSQKDEFTRVTTFICTLLTQNASSGYLSISLHDNGCITVKAYLLPFSPILQEVFITGSAGASHQPAAFCLLSPLLLVLFSVFHIAILTNLSSSVNIIFLLACYFNIRSYLFFNSRAHFSNPPI